MRRQRRKILLIDPALHHYHNKLSSSLTDCEIILMPDKHQACEYFFHNNIDLVLLDHNNESPGLDLIKYFKSLKQFVPIIVFSANSSEELATKVFRLGAKDYFRKPFAVDEIIESIKNALGITYLECNRRRDNIGRGLYCIHKYYNSEIKLSHAAREAGMSVSCFERKFKEKTGKTFIRYVNELRVAKAKDILKEEGLSMNDVAFACGFTNQFHFTRMFKKIANISPMGYRITGKSNHGSRQNMRSQNIFPQDDKSQKKSRKGQEIKGS